jgi:hypothetical protein
VADEFPNDTLVRRRLRSLVERHFPFVRRTARRLGMRPADADDVTQGVFVVLARRLADVEAGRELRWLIESAGVDVAAQDTEARAPSLVVRRASRDVVSDPEPMASVAPLPRRLPPCSQRVVARGHALIDDFEDGNARLSNSDGRSGTWRAGSDGTGGWEGLREWDCYDLHESI